MEGPSRAATNSGKSTENRDLQEITPARKRKADEESRKTDTKKSKPTFTPLRSLRRHTPVRKEKMADASEGRTKPDKPVMMNELKDCLGEWTSKLSDKLNKALTATLTKDFSEAVSVVANSVANNTNNIEMINGTIRRLEEEATASASKLEQKIERLESVVLASRSSSQNRNKNAPVMDILQVDMKVREENIAKSESYSISRRSLRIWPVKGSTDEEVREAAIAFIRNKLGVDQNDLQASQVSRVRRSKPPRKSRIKFEALVTFDDKYTRDTVSSHGRNLSDYVDSAGLPTAGIRLDYPAYLGAPFRALDWYGKQMRDRHGRGTRRNIKFDDDEENLYIDVCLPDQEYWHRITPEEAKRYRTEVESERASNSRKSLEGPVSNLMNNPRSSLQPRSTNQAIDITSISGTSNGVSSNRGNDGYISPTKRR